MCSVGHLTSVAYPSAFNSSNIQSGFHVSGLWLVNADIFRDDEYMSSYVTDRPEPTDQLTAPETHQMPAINVNVLLHPSETDQQVAGKSLSTPSTSKTTETSPKSLEEIRPFPKAQSS
jgi:hypothetical protein